MNFINNIYYIKQIIKNKNLSILLNYINFDLEILTKEEILIILNSEKTILLHFLDEINDLSKYIEYNQQLIHIVAEYDYVNVIVYLINNGVDINNKCLKKKWRPINYAINNNNKKSVKFLLQPELAYNNLLFKDFTNIKIRKNIINDRRNKKNNNSSSDEYTDICCY